MPRTKTYPHRVVVLLTDEQLQYLNEMRSHGPMMRALLQVEMDRERARRCRADGQLRPAMSGR